MFLKRIEMFGFKSFADRARIEFQDGVSALLGPNGCGKSNVVDAVKWVLGEQGSRQLRAEKMEDVIFNGTENRKALNVAEVALTLANDNGLLELDVPEVEVKRRLYRNGDSEYYINNTPVRLRELKELFFDTGVGKSAYSIMEQGKIDQILSNKPEERRYIFEEAAGITKFKIKGAEAARKLERTEDNIRQVDGILKEVKRSYDSLQIQSNKTLSYRKLKEESFHVELKMQLLKLASFEERLEKTKLNLGVESEKRAGFKSRVDELNQSLEQNLDQVNTMESELIEAQKKLYGLELERNNTKSQIKILGERKDHLDQQIQAAQGKLQRTEEKIQGIQEEIEGKIKEREELQKKIQDAEKNIQDFEASITQAQNRVEHNKNTIVENETRITSLEERQKELQYELRGLTDDIVNELDQRLKEVGFSGAGQDQSAQEIRTLLEETRIILEGRKDLILDIQSSGSTDALGDLIGSMDNLLQKVGRARELFDQYQKNSPDFLQEFLSPEGILTKKRNIEQELENAQEEGTKRREENHKLREENQELQNKIEEYRHNLEELRIGKARMDSNLTSLGNTLERLGREKAEEEVRKTEIIRDREADVKRKDEIQENISTLADKGEKIDQQENELKAHLGQLEKGITEKNKDLLGKEREVKDLMEKMSTVQTKVEKLQMESAQIQTEIKNLFDNFRDKHSLDLGDYREEIAEIDLSTSDLRQKLSELKDSIKGLGQVNLMAPEEFAEVEERYKFLTGQLDDLQKAKDNLLRVTQEIQKESTELFLASYREIRKYFHDLFRRLFGGGRAELKLSDPENVLESGIEMFCQPPGKKLENIALLSGGERSLTAVALLFATYLVKPSPFCILDEIDAALDEANVGRFVSMLMEFGEKSQFVVITHNKRTVAGANSLIGVTMEESGVSKIISLKLNRQEEV